jgi:hypothetical protein
LPANKKARPCDGLFLYLGGDAVDGAVMAPDGLAQLKVGVALELKEDALSIVGF